ncbi:hypothetical protein ASC61_02410 [Aeromicrobium sp. Root344]|uniref:Ig-like domain-containing protein n=1 Tax=Aeromicrobium sp. Root344 TaxID=1736521 RepID=UPI0006F6B29F|nr:Ig-like domain-containing protein [Aeromicrobium sp. Root344]KQV73948.1 hypothetical protein ASC61_02410 [Aeromicrobium sp. Root344]
MVWPIVVSGVAAGVGVAATAVTLLTPVDSGAQVWIDEPLTSAVLAPGTITVTAHATDPERLDGLQLKVDGKQVDQDRSLARDGLLVFAAFTWRATSGAHELVVTQLGGAGDVSEARSVTVSGPTTAPAPAPTGTTPTPSASPSPTPSTPTSAVPTEPSQAPSTQPPDEPADPVIDAAAFVGTPTVYQVTGCPYSVQVQARIRDATSARAEISGAGAVPMSRSSSTWTATIPSGFPAGQVGDHTVTVRASGPGGTADLAVGTLTIKNACPKD